MSRQRENTAAWQKMMREREYKTGSPTGAGLRMTTNANRLALDNYPTPLCATRALLEHESFHGTIMEPACGEGYMSVILEEAGYDVISSDINKKCYGLGNIDFFSIIKEDITKNQNIHSIITNPPYRYSTQFIEHALSLVDEKVAMFLQLRFLNGIKNYEILSKTKLTRVYVFSRLLPYVDNKGIWQKRGAFPHAWYIWDKRAKHKNHIELRLISPEHTHSDACWNLNELIRKR